VTQPPRYKVRRSPRQGRPSEASGNGTENNWTGDYPGNTWTGDTFIAAWMDSSNGVDMQKVIGGVRLR